MFPDDDGEVEHHGSDGLPHEWQEIQRAAGITAPRFHKRGPKKGQPTMVLDDGRPVQAIRGKYTGLHALRHFFASWCIAPPKDGGLGLLPKAVQVRMGHSTLAMTMDTYGHLFPSKDDAEVLAAGERALMGA